MTPQNNLFAIVLKYPCAKEKKHQKNGKKIT